jgi:hypothetical protein
MINERNGVTFFEAKQDYADHRALKALDGVSLGDVRFPFGFFLVDEGGKKVVVPGTQEDHRKMLLRAFPDIDPKAFTLGHCNPDSQGLGCHGGCSGFPSGYFCMRALEEDIGYYGCACVPRF